MPVIMLLRGLTASLRATVRTLTPWLEIVEHESVLVERARAAFLVHWWGSGTPVTRLNLSGYIVNLRELQDRFAAVQGSVPVSPGGPNAVGSLLGLAGMIAGMALDPLYAMAGIHLLSRFAGDTWTTLGLAVLWWLTPFLLAVGAVAAPLGTAVLVGGGLAAAGFGYGLLVALGDRREVRAAHDLFGSLTRLFIAAGDLVGQVLGDRMRNPLTAGLVIAGRSLGRLLGQVLGATAFLVVRVGPALGPVAALLTGLASLAGALAGAIGEVAGSTATRAKDSLAVGPLLARVTAALRGVLTVTGAAFGGLFEIVTGVLTALAATPGATPLLGGLGPFVRALITGHPTVRVGTALRAELEVFTAALAAVPPKPKPKETDDASSGPGRLAPLLAVVPDLPDVSFPKPPRLPVVKVAPPVPVVEPLSVPRLPAVRVPALTLPELPEPPGFLSTPVDLTPLKAIVDHLLPAAMRGPVQEKLDRLLADFPVAELPGSEVLRPVVHTLRLRVPGADPDELRRFQDGLLARLRSRPYLTGTGG